MDLSIFSLENRLAVVTGGGSGIGFSIAKFLAKAGAKVVLVSRREEVLLKAQEELRRRSYDAEIYVGDLALEENMKKIATDITKDIGSPDIVVNAAGVNFRQKEPDITYDTWNQTIDLNLKAPFFFTREFIPGMIERGRGKVIHIASLQSVRAFPNSIPYGASKGGIIQLTRAMAEEYSRHGISVNAIAPGFFRTALAESVFKEKEKELAKQTAIGRNGKLSDFEGLAIFLASSASDYMTGQTIFLDGGFSAK